MDLFDGEVTTADKIDRPERALEKEAIDDFMKRNPMAYGGKLTTGPNKGKHKFTVGKNKENVGYFDTIEEGEEWEKKTRTKKGYDKPKGKKIPKSELNKGAQYFYGVDYDNLKDDKELTKEKTKLEKYQKVTVRLKWMKLSKDKVSLYNLMMYIQNKTLHQAVSLEC